MFLIALFRADCLRNDVRKMKTVFWDLCKAKFNLGGRINAGLLYCFFWGIAAVMWMRLMAVGFADMRTKPVVLFVA